MRSRCDKLSLGTNIYVVDTLGLSPSGDIIIFKTNNYLKTMNNISVKVAHLTEACNYVLRVIVFSKF